MTEKADSFPVMSSKLNAGPDTKIPRLAIVISHPIQYICPWFQQIAQSDRIQIKVFYLWDFGVRPSYDLSFRREIQWDIPMLDGYEHCFVPNVSKNAGTHRFFGLVNPTLVSEVDKWGPDAVLVFGYKFYTHLQLLCSRRLRALPMLFRGDSHDLYRQPGPKLWLGRLARRVLFRRFDAFLAVGSANARYFRNSGVPADKIFLAPHCVDNRRFRSEAEAQDAEAQRWKDQLGISRGAFVVMYAGKFEDKKRPLDLLQAFQSFRSTVPVSDDKPALVFVGNGKLEHEIKKRAESERNNSIFFDEFKNQSRMPAIYRAADVFVLGSFGEGETWGLAINEVMNVGRPVIVSSHVGCVEDLVEEGVTGWRFEAGNPESLAGALQKAWIAGKSTRGRMGLAARTKIESYSYEAATEGLIDALEHAIGRH